jgi:hypothetical protein
MDSGSSKVTPIRLLGAAEEGAGGFFRDLAYRPSLPSQRISADVTEIWPPLVSIPPILLWVNNNHHVAGKDMCVGFLCIRV